MNLLLDTHVWLWMELDPDRLGPRTKEALESEGSDLKLSIVSVWELMIKAAKGKLRLPREAQSYIRYRLDSEYASLLGLSVNHAYAVGQLKGGHGDLFDRMLVCQARCESMTLVTADSRLFDYPVQTIDART